MPPYMLHFELQNIAVKRYLLKPSRFYVQSNRNPVSNDFRDFVLALHHQPVPRTVQRYRL